MKNYRKFEINPERIIKNEEMVTLKGGTGTSTSFWCKHNSVVLGCVTYSTCNLSAAETWCAENCPGFDTIVYSCGNTPDCGI